MKDIKIVGNKTPGDSTVASCNSEYLVVVNFSLITISNIAQPHLLYGALRSNNAIPFTKMLSPNN
jgi:hypothetical protein